MLEKGFQAIWDEMANAEAILKMAQQDGLKAIQEIYTPLHRRIMSQRLPIQKMRGVLIRMRKDEASARLLSALKTIDHIEAIMGNILMHNAMNRNERIRVVLDCIRNVAVQIGYAELDSRDRI